MVRHSAIDDPSEVGDQNIASGTFAQAINNVPAGSSGTSTAPTPHSYEPRQTLCAPLSAFFIAQRLRALPGILRLR
jgi:hypothetical protein